MRTHTTLGDYYVSEEVYTHQECAFLAVAAFLALAAPALKGACPALAAALAKLAVGRAQMEVRLNDGLGRTST